jgi:hypothetical protein
VTVDSEQRLGQTLLQLARTMGKKDPRSIRIELKISHEELSEMLGTTRPRVSLFMERFRHLGLIETNKEHFLIIKENQLTDYLPQMPRRIPRVARIFFEICTILDRIPFRVRVSLSHTSQETYAITRT